MIYECIVCKEPVSEDTEPINEFEEVENESN